MLRIMNMTSMPISIYGVEIEPHGIGMVNARMDRYIRLLQANRTISAFEVPESELRTLYTTTESNPEPVTTETKSRKRKSTATQITDKE